MSQPVTLDENDHLAIICSIVAKNASLTVVSIGSSRAVASGEGMKLRIVG